MHHDAMQPVNSLTTVADWLPARELSQQCWES